jgi:hypothetical protein
MSAEYYDRRFFDQHAEGSRRSAEVFLASLFAVWTPASLIDFGCGRGAWLAVAMQLGVERLVGIDGGWISRTDLMCDKMEFRVADLNTEINLLETFDLAMSLEVAEHVRPESTDTFFVSLTRLSDAILFSAAFVGQPGLNHINTRLHSFWAERFINSGFQLFDFFRPNFWSDNRIEPWYRQNTFLYVRPSHPLNHALRKIGRKPLYDTRFVDCVHPWFYTEMLKQIATL